MANINVLDHWNPVNHYHLSNFINVEHHILLGLDNFDLLRNIHGLNNLGVSAMAQQHISAAQPALSSGSAAVVPPNAVDYSSPCLPHACLIMNQS